MAAKLIRTLLVILILLLVVSCKRSAVPPVATDVAPQAGDATATPIFVISDSSGDGTATPPTGTEEVPPETEASPTETVNTPEPPQTSPPVLFPPVESGVLGEVWTLSDVRFGFHDGFIRVVVEMGEARNSIPFYTLKEVDNAAVPFPSGADASWGTARIDLVISDLYAYDATVTTKFPLIPGDNPSVIKIGQYPTYDDVADHYRVPALYKTIQEQRKNLVNEGYPYILTTGRQVEHMGGGAETRSCEYLVELQPEMYAEINPTTAMKLDVSHWDYVWVETLRGKIKVRANVTERVNEQTIFCPYHWAGWFEGESYEDRWPEGTQELAVGDSVNIICVDAYDRSTNMQETKACLCKVYKA